MKSLRFASAFVAVLMLAAVFVPHAVGGEEGWKSITITIDRKTMGQSVFYPGRFFTDPATVTVDDFTIRDYFGVPIDGFTIQTSSGKTEIPICTVKEISFCEWVRRKTSDIMHVEHIVKATMVLTDGEELPVLMNADFGTIEGKTDLGNFFLKDPHTIRHLVFR